MRGQGGAALTLSGIACAQTPRSLAARAVVDRSPSIGTVCLWKRKHGRCAIAGYEVFGIKVSICAWVFHMGMKREDGDSRDRQCGYAALWVYPCTQPGRPEGHL